MDLGFVRIDDKDEVWFDEYGYNYFIVYKDITPHIILDWNPIDQKITLHYCDEEGMILSKFQIKSKEKLEAFIKETKLISDFKNIKSFFKTKNGKTKNS